MSQITSEKLLAADVPEDRIKSGNLSGLIIGPNEDLCEITLIRINLRGTTFRNLDLRNTHFVECEMRDTRFVQCNMNQVQLRNLNAESSSFEMCTLVEAKFTDVILSKACFANADLRNVSFARCNVEQASFCSAVLTQATFLLTNIERVYKNYLTVGLHPAPEGDLIGYGKKGDHIVTLLIPKEARRSCATSRKYRAEYAKVLHIETLFGAPGPNTVTNAYCCANGLIKHTRYTVGEYVYPDDWDEDRWNECSNGIHFWLTKEEARQW